MSFVKKVIQRRIEMRKRASYWLAKSFRLMLFYVFKDEIMAIGRWIYANIDFSAISLISVCKTLAFAGFVFGSIVTLALLVDMLIKKENLENFPDRIEAILKKMDSLLEEKIANL